MAFTNHIRSFNQYSTIYTHLNADLYSTLPDLVHLIAQIHKFVEYS